MNEKARSQRLAVAKLAPGAWFGWLGVGAMFLLAAVRVRAGGGVWYFPLLSLGEWLLLPLGVASLTMGYLSLSRVREKTLLPLWIAAIVPAALWLIGAAGSMAYNGAGAGGGDMFLAWAVHLIFPTLTFLPLLTMRVWRDRLMWALAAGVAVNAVAVFWQARFSGISPPDAGMLRFGGFLANQHDYGLMLGMALPLITAWHGGERAANKALANLLCTFLLPVLALSACFGWVGLAASAVGLIAAWTVWRSYAWVLGVFVCLLVFGYGAEGREASDQARRRLFADSAMMGGSAYRRAFNTFQVRPYLGSGPESFASSAPAGAAADSAEPRPWYAALLGGTGVVGLGMWLALLGELLARAAGRYGRRCLWYGGVMGGVLALTAAGVWTDALPEGAGALVGLLLAVSILEEPEAAPEAGRRRRRDGEAAAAAPAPAAKGSGDTDVFVKR